MRRHRTPVGTEKWGWRIALTGYVLATAASFGEYWTPYLDETFLFLALPSVLISLIGSGVLGVALLRRGFQPRATGLLLLLWLPLLIGLSSLIGLGAAALPMLWAWGLAGRALAAVPPEPASAVREPAFTCRPRG